MLTNIKSGSILLAETKCRNYKLDVYSSEVGSSSEGGSYVVEFDTQSNDTHYITIMRSCLFLKMKLSCL